MPLVRPEAFAMLLAWLAVPCAQAADANAAPGTGTLLFRARAESVPAPRLATDIDIAVAGTVARVSVTQSFHNPGPDWVEGVYVFPLPDDAAVDGLTMRVGERVVVGEIREREQAERIYTQARDAGQRAALVAQARPNLFTTSVANIGPGERVDITIEYLQTARYDAGEFSLRFPMTITPRYSGAQGRDGSAGPRAARSGGGIATARTSGTDATRASTPVRERASAGRLDAAAEHRARIRVEIDAGLPLAAIDSAHHAVRTVRDGTVYTLETREPAVAMHRDFVVRWRAAVGDGPALAAVTETRGGSTYAQLMILPPAGAHDYAAQPREVIFVVDTSGSMGGVSIEQARAALGEGLGRLGGGDRFNVFEFDSTTSSLYRTPVALDASSYRQALAYVEALSADGGTEMGPAIRAALSQPATPGYLRQVVFLTDGGVANETELFRVIREHLGDARLFTIGIGSAPNSYFMRKAAEFGRGTYTHIGDTAEVGERMTALLDKLERVALTDLVADWPDAVEYFPHRIPDLYAGEPVVLVGRYDAPLARPVSVELFGRAGGLPWSRAVEIGPGRSAGVASLWARRKIEHTVDAKVEGLDPALIRELVVDVALEHGMLSPYTSLVAVDRTPARSAAALARRAVAGMVPAGAVLGPLPQTATYAPLYRWLGLALLAVGLVLALRCRRVELGP